MSTASHHLRALERTMGVALFNHGHRPFVLTAVGVIRALTAFEQGATEALSGNLMLMRRLRLAMVEDFDAQISPELAAIWPLLCRIALLRI